MAATNLEERIDALEQEVRLIKSVIKKAKEGQLPWWERFAGTFKDDPLFDEIVEQGLEYRKELSRRTR